MSRTKFRHNQRILSNPLRTWVEEEVEWSSDSQRGQGTTAMSFLLAFAKRCSLAPREIDQNTAEVFGVDRTILEELLGDDSLPDVTYRVVGLSSWDICQLIRYLGRTRRITPITLKIRIGCLQWIFEKLYEREVIHCNPFRIYAASTCFLRGIGAPVQKAEMVSQSYGSDANSVRARLAHDMFFALLTEEAMSFPLSEHVSMFVFNNLSKVGRATRVQFPEQGAYRAEQSYLRALRADPGSISRSHWKRGPVGTFAKSAQKQLGLYLQSVDQSHRDDAESVLTRFCESLAAANVLHEDTAFQAITDSVSRDAPPTSGWSHIASRLRKSDYNWLSAPVLIERALQALPGQSKSGQPILSSSRKLLAALVGYAGKSPSVFSEETETESLEQFPLLSLAEFLSRYPESSIGFFAAATSEHVRRFVDEISAEANGKSVAPIISRIFWAFEALYILSPEPGEDWENPVIGVLSSGSQTKRRREHGEIQEWKSQQVLAQ